MFFHLSLLSLITCISNNILNSATMAQACLKYHSISVKRSNDSGVNPFRNLMS